MKGKVKNSTKKNNINYIHYLQYTKVILLEKQINSSTIAYLLIYSASNITVVVVDPLLPDYWGESASVVFWGFAASFSRQLSSRAATPEGSLHKSRAESVVGICGQLKRCCVVCS